MVVDANANHQGGGSSNATACANLQLLAEGPLNVGGLNVQADALNEGSGKASASAHANGQGTNVTVGNAIVKSVATADGVALSNATLLLNDGSFVLVTGSINVEADLAGSGFGPIGANALASLTGNTITVDGRIRVVANTKGSHASTSVFANAQLLVNSKHNVHFESTVDVEAHVNGSDAPLFNAHPIVHFNASNVVVDNTLTVLASANGASGTSVKAIPVLDFTTVPNILFNGIDLEAIAHGNGMALVLASADLTYTGPGSNFHDRGQTKLHAKASGTGVHEIHALANLTIDVASDIAFDGGIDVEATANGNGAHSVLASAFATLTANNMLTFGNDVTVQADATGTDATKITAQAIALLTGDKGIDVTSGNVAVRANVTASNSVSFGTAAAVASLDAVSRNGGEHFAGDVDVTVNVVYETSSLRYSSIDFPPFFFDPHFAVGNVIALANAVMQASNGDIGVGGDIDVEAKLRSNARNLGEVTVPDFGLGDIYFEQTAAAFLNVEDHKGDITLHGVTDKATANLDGNGIAAGEGTVVIAGAIALANIEAPSGSVSIDGPLDVEAQMTARNEGFHTLSEITAVGALAVLNVQARDQIQTKSVTVNAYASASSFFVEAAFGIADAIAIANFSAGNSVKIDGDVDVQANYNGFFGTNELALAIFHVDAHSNFASVNGNLNVRASVNMHNSENHDGGFACHELALTLAGIQAGSGASITGNVVVAANAQGEHVFELAIASANLTVDASHIVIDGGVDVEAQADASDGRECVCPRQCFARWPERASRSMAMSRLPPRRSAARMAAAMSQARPSSTRPRPPAVLSTSAAISACWPMWSTTAMGTGIAFPRRVSKSAPIPGFTSAAPSRRRPTCSIARERAKSGERQVRAVRPLSRGAAAWPRPRSTSMKITRSGITLGGLSVKASADVVNPDFGGALGRHRPRQCRRQCPSGVQYGSVTITGDVIGSAFAHDAGKGGAQALTLIDLEPGAYTGWRQQRQPAYRRQCGDECAGRWPGPMPRATSLAVAVLNADADRGRCGIDGNIPIRANAQNLRSESSLRSRDAAAAYANAHLEATSGVSVGGGIAVLASI